MRRVVRLAGGILKALFTTSPTEATEVVITLDGETVVRPASEMTITYGSSDFAASMKGAVIGSSPTSARK
jgi:hypothetical protein